MFGALIAHTKPIELFTLKLALTARPSETHTHRVNVWHELFCVLWLELAHGAFKHRRIDDGVEGARDVVNVSTPGA